MDNQTKSSNAALLERTQSLILAERTLTATIEKVEPWLVSNTLKKSALTSHMGTRVRPIPRTMEEVHQILAVGRNLATRSAPSGWNSSAPVVGFNTPNPLPHQLRGGTLAALQLDRARKAENDKKRQREEAEVVVQQAAKKREEEEEVLQAKTEKQEEKIQQQKEVPSQQLSRPQLRRVTSNPPVPSTDTNMRLSSSSEEESSSDEDDED